MLPPIRYPLPTLVALVLGSLLAWQGVEWSKGWRAEMAKRVKLAMEGPPVPNSPRPQLVAGPVTRRALLLLDETPATSRPDGPIVETIDRRMFVDVFDTWPSPGPISHLRVGNRKAIGWVPLADVLLWNSRLVIRAPDGSLTLSDQAGGPGQKVEVGSSSLPVIGWKEGVVEVAAWDRGHPWSKVARRGWVRMSELPPEAWGVWISQVELPILLGMANQGDAPLVARLRAVFGRLVESRPWTSTDIEDLRKFLPSMVLVREANAAKSAEGLAELNARPAIETRWSGLSFQFLPLNLLP